MIFGYDGNETDIWMDGWSRYGDWVWKMMVGGISFFFFFFFLLLFVLARRKKLKHHIMVKAFATKRGATGDWDIFVFVFFGLVCVVVVWS